MSARISRQERVQQDLDELLGQLAILAKALIIRNGEFFPFGATIGKRGKYTLVTPVPESDQPTPHDVVDAILSEIQTSRDTFRAYGVTMMAATAEGADAVRIELEHVEGSSLVIALPYARGDFGAFAYGDMGALLAERRVWTAEPKAPTRPSRSTSRAKSASKAAPKKAAPKKAAPKKAAPTGGPKPSKTTKTTSPREATRQSGTSATGHRSAHPTRKSLRAQPV